MRVALVGTELAAVVPGAGAIENLLCGWAEHLGRSHDVVIVSMPQRQPPEDGLQRVWCALPAGLPAALRGISPHVVVLQNRPGWHATVDAACLHLFHNWPDAWGLAGDPPALAGGTVAAVSAPLADVVAAALGRDRSEVAVVEPFVDALFGTTVARPEPRLVVAPNRLLRKKGIAELCAAAGRPALDRHRVLVTDHLSPWPAPTAEHRELRAIVRRSRCELIPAETDRLGVADLYARAAAVVVPSVRPEGFGMVAAEAQTVGVPVASSGLGGLAESTLLPGLVADPTDPDALAEAIASAAASSVATRSLLKEKASARWSPAGSVASLLAAVELSAGR